MIPSLPLIGYVVSGCPLIVTIISERDDAKENTDTLFDQTEKEPLFDWNVLMQDVIDGHPGQDVNATLIKDLLQKHYAELKESKV